MSEFVDCRMESLIPEMKLMLVHNLFTRDEVKIIIKRRREFEYQLKKHTKSKLDFVNFINFESNLYRDLKNRRERYSIRKDMDKIDLAVVRHVDSLYKNTLNRFSDDVRIWIAYIQFCTYAGFNDSIPKAFTRMLQKHTEKPQLFSMAAKWEREKNNSLENALAYLVKGLAHHPADTTLLKEAFNLTLAQAKTKEVPDIAQAEIMYKSALKNVNEVDFMIGLLKIAQQYPFTEPLQKKMLKDLEEMFPHAELVRHMIARHMLHDKTTENNSTVRLFKTVQFYKESVDKIRTKDMWSCYIDTLLEFNQDPEIYLEDELEALDYAFAGGHKAGLLSVTHYMQWLKLLNRFPEENAHKVARIINEATEKNQQSLELWVALLKCNIASGDAQAIKRTFGNAVKALGDEALPIWRLLIMHQMSILYTDDAVQDVFLQALKEPPAISNPIKSQYLDWLTVAKSIRWARNAYNAFASQLPLSVEVHRKMASLESMQVDPDMENWRKCHENATRYFGKDNKDVWLDYIKFETTFGDPMKAPGLYNRARETLEPALKDVFEFDYAQMIADQSADTKPTVNVDTDGDDVMIID